MIAAACDILCKYEGPGPEHGNLCQIPLASWLGLLESGIPKHVLGSEL